MAKNFQLAIVGLGGMGNWHRELIETIDRLTVRGSFDIKEDRQQFARDHGLIAYDSLDALLADPEIDIVLASVPNDVHKEVVTKALRAGKSVVCEKPAALNSAELQEMIDVAEETGNFFTVHQNRRWDEDFLTVKNIYDQRLLGDIFRIESRVHGSRGIPGDWRQEKEHGGGMILDWGVHILDQMLQMVDSRVKRVYTTVTNVTNQLVDDGFTAELTFENGLVALLEVGTSNFINLPRWYVLGENGTAVINDWDLSGKIVRVTNWDKNDAVPVRTAAGLTKTMAPRTDETIREEKLPIVHSDIRDFYRNVMATIEGKEVSNIKLSEVMRVMKLMEAMFRSAETHQAVNFE